ncbi:hypothetical protein Droror1_Dr00015310 [Drosera rotundifolia]
MTRKFPPFSYYNLERKVKPFVKFLLELGVPESDIPRVLYRSPQLCGISLSKNLIPTMKYLEELGVDNKKRLQRGGQVAACCQVFQVNWCRCGLYCPTLSSNFGT